MNRRYPRVASVWPFILIAILLGSQIYHFWPDISRTLFDDKEKYFLPAEFDVQEAIWISADDSTTFRPFRAGIIKELKPYVKINIVGHSEEAIQSCKQFLNRAYIDYQDIDFHVIKDNAFWMRDHGALFMINKKGGSKVVDFGWDRYGYEQWLHLYSNGDTSFINQTLRDLSDSEIGRVDERMGFSKDIDVIKSWINIEGGSIEVNGKGTLLLSEALTLGRNKGASKDSIEQELKRVLGIEKIIWLKEGLAEDPLVCENIVENFIGIGTGGHTDEYVRFADAHTILLAWVPEEERFLHPINAMNYERMKANYEILRNAKDQDGHSFNIIKVPLPKPIATPIVLTNKPQWDGTMNIPAQMLKPGSAFKAGDSMYRVATASYLNFFITNKVVLVPTYKSYGTPAAKEHQVKEILEDAFPDRSILFIDALPLNWRGGGPHCAIQYQAKTSQP